MARGLRVVVAGLILIWAAGARPVVAQDTPPPAPPHPVDRYSPPPLRASAAALLDVTTGHWLLLQNADTPRAQASTTKIMTAMLAISAGHLDDNTTVDAGAAAVGLESGSRMGLVAGERLTIRDLLYGLMLPSGNDAALAIAAHVGGSIPHFVAMMNDEATRLGLAHTHFADPHGLDAPDHYTSARDLVLLARHAMDSPVFRQIVATHSYFIPATPDHDAHALTNLNYVVDWYPGADGVKPGFTGNAGICQVVSARRHGHWLIGALMNTPDLHTDMRDLMNFGFGDFTWAPSGQAGDSPWNTIDDGTPAAPSLYFPATGHRVRNGFLDYFIHHGGVAVLGFPRTDEFVEDSQTVQYFERARLWWDDTAQVAISTPLGQAAVYSPALLRPGPPVHDTATRLYVPITGHVVRAAILAAYQTWGGAATFGYPLTEELVTGNRTVQYFSNAVFQWTPAGGITLLPLGDMALRRRGYL